VRIISNPLPPPTRLTSVVPEETVKTAPPVDESQFKLKRWGIFCGSGRWIFIGILAGAAALSIAGLIFGQQEAARREAAAVQAVRRLFSVTTHSLSSPPHSTATPAPVTVQINADMLHVSAIALGHPRLAVINGIRVGEGDVLTVHTPLVVRLRVLKIADGRIELSSGSQVICARLAAADVKPLESH
jgi:hypothetical protein